MRQSETKKMVFLSLLVAIGVAIGFFENMIPLPIPLPGARLGLSNIVILTVIIAFGSRQGITVALIKSILLMLVTGNVTSFFYSFSGALLSSIFMALSYGLLKDISIIGVSLIGAFFHNLGQVLVATVIVQNIALFGYLPMLLILGLFTGIFVGIVSKLFLKHLGKIGLVKEDRL